MFRTETLKRCLASLVTLPGLDANSKQITVYQVCLRWCTKPLVSCQPHSPYVVYRTVNTIRSRRWWTSSTKVCPAIRAIIYHASSGDVFDFPTTVNLVQHRRTSQHREVDVIIAEHYRYGDAFKQFSDAISCDFVGCTSQVRSSTSVRDASQYALRKCAALKDFAFCIFDQR